MSDKENPGVWSDLPEDAVSVYLYYMRKNAVGVFPGPEYTRKLPKTKARKIAERKAYGASIDSANVRIEKSRLADIIEAAINEALDNVAEVSNERE